MNENKPNITHIFCDVDFSIFNTTKREYINPTIEALELAQKNGKKVIIVSSKSVPTLEQIKLFETLPYISGYICNCMGYGKVEGIKYDNPIPFSILEQIAEDIDAAARFDGGEATEFQFVCGYFDPLKRKRVFEKKYYTYSNQKDHNEIATQYALKWNDQLGECYEKYGKDALLELFNEYDVYSIMVFPSSPNKNSIITSLSNEVFGSDKLVVNDKPFDGMYNITFKATRKYTWVNSVIQKLGVAPQNCLAIGDGLDDAEMGDACNKQFIGVVCEGHDSGATRYENENNDEIGFFRKANLLSDDIYNIFLELDLIKPLPSFVGGKLSDDIKDDALKQIGYVSCSKTSEKNLDKWSTDKDVYFLGINGYGKIKGRKDADADSKYNILKRHIDKNDSTQTIKVLLLDPSSKKFDRHIEGITSYKTLISYKDAYERWFELARLDSKCLDLRFYESDPPFFMKAIDNYQVSITKFSSESSYIDSFEKKEPSFVLDFAAENIGKDGETKETVNTFCSNTVTYFNNLFNKSKKYNNYEYSQLETMLKRKIASREKKLKPILFCYSSKNDVEIIYHIEDMLRENGFDPIEWNGYNFGSDWSAKVEDIMKSCSCVIFFLGENVFASEKDNVVEELYSYYQLRKSWIRFLGRFSRKTEYLLVSMLERSNLDNCQSPS